MLGKRRYKKFNPGAYNNRPYKKPKYTPKRGRSNAPLKRMQNMRTGGYLGIEKKFKDHTLDSTVVSLTNLLSSSLHDPPSGSLCTIAQGDGESERDGKKVTLKTLLVTVILRTADNVGVENAIRLLVVKDTQSNGAQLTPSYVLESPPQTIDTLSTHRNLQYTTRFNVLYDKIHYLKTTPFYSTQVSGSSPIKVIKLAFDLNNTVVNYTDTSASISNIMDNSYHLMAVADRNATVTMSYSSRVRFIG